MSYQPPRSTVTSPQNPAFRPMQLAIGLIAPLLIGLGTLAVVPQFKATFRSFGTDLPWATQILMDYPWMLCLAPLAVLALWAAWPKRRRDNAACLFGVIFAMAAAACVVLALYWPIFQLAASI
ncbi:MULTISPECIES: hypothetical protein [unclassified Lysobacter]|uniref:hypothetical protein n=1 Tax=unclassified Lysobacter TaxID=2635362 RepID=UPI001BE528A1|nr:MULTISPECIES: hypothetical protein [unclassified Lysobacter]MBT2746793.1 hypothetical protein [Lysobacter sp. ISL-42]MBT2750722.1 hypothetical protein [Lysobacter sp. ISL-50]MBT2779551.1 hypothetical protein [Lysobacter sp. ISL-54]MBT2782881.1 hypothetical protein [Lysobacter sp. ISL-52]